jgi:hypothetical protein
MKIRERAFHMKLAMGRDELRGYLQGMLPQADRETEFMKEVVLSVFGDCLRHSQNIYEMSDRRIKAGGLDGSRLESDKESRRDEESGKDIEEAIEDDNYTEDCNVIVEESDYESDCESNGETDDGESVESTVSNIPRRPITVENNSLSNQDDKLNMSKQHSKAKPRNLFTDETVEIKSIDDLISEPCAMKISKILHIDRRLTGSF